MNRRTTMSIVFCLISACATKPETETADLGGQDVAPRQDVSLSDTGSTDIGGMDSARPDVASADMPRDMSAPRCTSDGDCAGNSVCEAASGRCVCDPSATTCLVDVQPGHWLEVADSKLSAVLSAQDTVPGNPAAIIDAWGGAVYDTDRDRLVLWGGGHADYSGNEVYAFDLNSLQWERLNDPSLDVGGDEASGYYPDGLPRSRHTYDYIVYVPPLGAMCTMGGAAMWMSGQINVSSVDCFSFDTLAWSRYADAPEGTIAGIADYDPVAGQVAYVAGPQLRYLATWNVGDDMWTSHGDNFTNGGLGIRLTGRADPVARRFVAVGNGAGYTWDLDNSGNFAEVALGAANPPTNFDANNPGLTFDSALGRIVFWGGGGSIWSLDLTQNTWVEHAPAADNMTLPTPPNANGTYGRFRYSPTFDVYVLVNAVDQNVFVFRRP